MVPFDLSPAQKEVVTRVLKSRDPAIPLTIAALPQHYQYPLLVLFAWVSVAYEIVENPNQDTQQTLQEYQQAFQAAWKSGRHDHIITQLVVQMAKSQHLPPKVFTDWLSSLQKYSQQSYFTSQELETYFSEQVDPLSNLVRLALFRPPSESQLWKSLGRWLGWVLILSHLGKNWERHQQILLPQDKLKKYDLSIKTLPEHFSVYSFQYYQFIQDWAPSLEQYRLEARQLLVVKQMIAPLKALLLISFDLSDWVWRLAINKPPVAWSINIHPPRKVARWVSFKWKLQLKWWPSLVYWWHWRQRQLLVLGHKVRQLLPDLSLPNGLPSHK